MKSIAYLIPTVDRIGGAERQVLLLAEGMARREWRVVVVALSGTGGKQTAALTQAGVEFVSLRMRKGLADVRGWLHLRRWLRTERPSVVHAHLPHAAWMARWSRLLAPGPAVIDTIHTSSTGTAGRRWGYKLSGWLTDQTTAVSRDAGDAWRAAGMVAEKKLAIVPNGLDTEQWKPDHGVRAAMRSETGIGDRFLWLAVGRLDAVKDYETMLRGFARTDDSSLLAIAGTGLLEAELRGLAVKLGLGERVRFLGFVPETVRWMQAADAYVLTSQWEGLPMSVMEAAACGLPIVATNVPGTRGLFDEGLDGVRVEAGNAAALAEAMQRVMALPASERTRMGANARRHVEARYDLDHVLQRWETLYDELRRD
jgi:glycosyltransferase involved in cell wall biosynthesis